MSHICVAASAAGRAARVVSELLENRVLLHAGHEAADLAGNADPFASAPADLATPGAFSVAVNFQTARSDTPAGFIPDVGDAFGDRGGGLSFGWDKDNRQYARNRNSARSPDERYDTFNQMQRSGGADSWEIAVPSPGKYFVTLAAGDPSHARGNIAVNVEGVLAVGGKPSDKIHWFEQTAVVEVTDGRLTLSNAAGAVHNKVNYVKVEKVGDDVPTSRADLMEPDPETHTRASSPAPANDYNFDGATHDMQGIFLNKSNVPLYDAAGQPLGLYINNKPNDSFPDGRLRFQGDEAITVGGRTYYYEWGVGGSDGQSGHVWIADMSARPTIDPNARGGSGGLYNGRSAPDILLADGSKKSYTITPTSIPSDMYYTGPSDGLKHSFSNYGTAGAPYSTNHTPLVWSWINKTGGGIARAQMLSGEVFYPSDVATININSTDANGVVNGSVKALYGSFWNGEQRIYGWTVHSHIYQGVYTAHLALLNG